MTVFATRLVNGTDTRERLRRADALGLFATGPGMARGGLRNDGGGVVTVNAGTMTVDVSPFTAWVDGGVSDVQGGYVFASDATETLTVSAGHASLSRTDVVIAEVRDTTHDGSGSTDARLRILEGTPGAGVPALPTNALALRNITVPPGLSAGTGGLASGNLSTDRRTYTTGLGGTLTVASQAERDALPTIVGTTVYRTDTNTVEVRTSSGWRVVSDSSSSGVTNSNADASSTTAYLRNGAVILNVSATLLVTTAVGDPIFVLPDGFRPPATIFGQLFDTAGAVVHVHYQADGLVRPQQAIAAGRIVRGHATLPL